MNDTFFKRNRLALTESVKNGLVVVTAYDAMQSSNDASYEYVQEANFWWLTGIEDSGWQVVIDGVRGRTTLVAPNKSEISRIFEGGLSDQDAIGLSGADDVIHADEFESYLRGLARKHPVAHTIYDSNGYDFVSNPAQKELYGTLSRIFTSVVKSTEQLARLRAIKQPEEIAAIKKAINLTVKAFEGSKAALDKSSYEYELEAIFGFEFRKKGYTHAYLPIVASGKNACTLHYGKNSAKLKTNDLVLIDIGARADGYAADITRTLAKGRPTKRQVQIHHAVESAHRDIIKLLSPGLEVAVYAKEVDQRMKTALMEVGLLKAHSDEVTYRKYFPHAISHGLGIDVHDSLGAPKYFEENMVLTVEPGIYIPEENIGVRIEDDILITSNGRQNMSGKLSTGL